MNSKLKARWDRQLLTIQEAIKVGVLTLTEKEADFIQNITIDLNLGKEISWKQSQWFRIIFERVE